MWLIAVAAALVMLAGHLWALVFTRISVGALPTQADLQKSPKYKRVVIFGVDGAGTMFQNADCHTPNFDRIFANGSISYKAMSQYPTASAHTWASVLHGVPYFVHRVTNEKAYHINFTSKRYYRGHEKYPSIFKVASKADPAAAFSSVCQWEAINRGIVEGAADFPAGAMFKCTTGPYYKDLGFDSLGCDWAAAKIAIDHGCRANTVAVKDFDPSALRDDRISFVCFDYCDHIGDGLRHGTGTPEYRDSVEQADKLIGLMYDAYAAKGWEKDTLFILVTDHGQRYSGGHGHNEKIVRECTLAVAGGLGNIIPGHPGKATTQDVASIALYALGIRQPKGYQSRVPFGMFRDLEK